MRSATSGFEVIIVGAGPAGSTAAIELARAGRRVLLIEKNHFPRSKVCGGCLSGPATTRLRALLGDGRPLPGVAARQITFVIGSYRLSCHPNGATRMVSRRTLDARLADAAASAGVEVRYGTPATLARGARGWDVCVGTDRLRADTVLVATGMTRLARTLGIRDRNRGRRMVAQQWVQPAGPALPLFGGVELHWLRHGYVGLATPVPGECVVAVAAETCGLERESALGRLRRSNPNAPLWEMLPVDVARRHPVQGSAGFPWRPDRLGTENILLIGDAAGYEEPYTGEGIGQAMESATCSAEAVLRGGDLLRRYTDRMRRRHRRTLWRCRALSRILGTSFVQYVVSRRPVLPVRPLTRLVERVHVRGA